MSDKPRQSAAAVPAWQAGWRMTEAMMPERPIDRAWRKRFAGGVLSAIAAVALWTIIAVIFWSVIAVLWLGLLAHMAEQAHH
jgi:hypothetical protein